MSTGGRDRTKLVVVVLGVAIAASLFFVRFLDEPTTERARPPGAEPTPTSLTSATPEIPPADGPTSTPAPEGFTLPDGSRCDSIPGDREISDTVFVDLDGDGDSDAVGPEIRLDRVNGLIEYGIFVALGECRWEPLGFVGEGRVRDANQRETTHSWTCSRGPSTGNVETTMLVQIITEPGPTPTTSLTQYSIVDDLLVEHPPTIIEGPVEIDGHAVACDPGYSEPDLTVRAEHCGGRAWRLEVPGSWLTTAKGEHSCQWFSTEPVGLPCQCDLSPSIHISVTPADSQPGRGLFSRTTVDGYPARVYETTEYSEVAGRVVNERIYSVDLGTERLALVASNQEAPMPWDELTAELDLFAAAIEIIGPPPPTMGMFYPEFPDLDPEPFYLDPAGTFALYRSVDNPGWDRCDSGEPATVARLTIAASRPDDLQFTPVGPIPPGRPEAIHVLDDGTTVLTLACRSQDGLTTYLQQTITLEPNGAITTIGDTSATSLIPGGPNPDRRFAVSPDGTRYFSGDDPLGRLDPGCATVGPPPVSPAQTMLRSSSGALVPAFPDIGVTDPVGNMGFTTSGYVVWDTDRCRAQSLYLGRLGDDGSIVDRHLISGPQGNDDTWTINGNDELIIVTPLFDRLLLPGLQRIDLATAPGWVTTADPPLRFDDEPVATSFTGEEPWRLGENRAATGECAGDTIYAEEPTGPRRVSDYRSDIEGSVVDVITSEVFDDERRIIVALAECPSQYQGVTAWFAIEYAGSRELWFTQAATGPVREVQDPFFPEDWPQRVFATVEFLDGRGQIMELVVDS